MDDELKIIIEEHIDKIKSWDEWEKDKSWF